MDRRPLLVSLIAPAVSVVVAVVVAVVAVGVAGGCTSARSTPAASTPPAVGTAPPQAAPSTRPTSRAPAVAPPETHIFARLDEPKAARILWTASVQGYVEPCGCTGDPLGGVARLAAAVKDAKRATDGRVLLLDAGDLLFEHESDNAPLDACQAGARDDLLVDTYGKLGLAATVLGPLDDVRGAEFRDARLHKAGIVTVGVDTPRALVAGAARAVSVVRVLGDVGVGVTAFRVDAPGGASDGTTAVVQRAHDALAAEVRRLATQAGTSAARHLDVIVVLAQAPRAITKRVVAGIPGIDIVIQGRAPGEVPLPPEALGGGAVLVAAGMQAQYVGVLELHLAGRTAGAPLALDDAEAKADADKKVLRVRIKELKRQVDDADGARKEFLAGRLATAEEQMKALDANGPSTTGPRVKVRALPLARGFPEDPGVKAALDAYTARIPSLVTSCEAGATCVPAPKDAATWVGAKACKGCHEEQYAFWKKQLVKLPGKDDNGRPITRTEGHVHAWDTLVADGKQKDRSCVGCHSVGFDAPGGPCKTGDVVARGLAAVQCESCHGPGSFHVESSAPEDIVGKPDEARCRTCHRVPHIPTTESFVMTDRLKLILGPGHGEKRFRALEAATAGGAEGTR